MSEDYTDDLTVADVTVFNNDIHVLVDFQPFQRRYRYEGTIGIDGVVEPLNITSYRPNRPTDENAAEQGKALAERYINEETPYRVWGGEQKYWQRTGALRGLQFSHKQTLSSLSAAEKRELLTRVERDDIILTGETDA